MGVAQRLISIDAPGQNNHRDPVLLGIGHHIDHVHQSRPHGCNQHHWRAVHMVDTFPDEPARILMFDQMEDETRALQRINDGQHFAARHSKRVSAPGLI